MGWQKNRRELERLHWWVWLITCTSVTPTRCYSCGGIAGDGCIGVGTGVANWEMGVRRMKRGMGMERGGTRGGRGTSKGGGSGIVGKERLGKR
ncbi:hypothetical protein ACH5RR_013442 [Cinchona calisaya]|uniref:Uncharacterized protein n=1 Tax=Cinchona calisaya TaxID=153742 RepID=A0ABD3A3D4_9GENT